MAQMNGIPETETAPVPAPVRTPAEMWMPVMSVQEFLNRKKLINDLIANGGLDEGSDYGSLSERGEQDKRKVLFKPGAEKLCVFFGLVPDFQLVDKTEQWPIGGQEGVFAYHYKCRLFRGDTKAGEGEGECNSLELKYRWRWVKAEDLEKMGNPKTYAERRNSIREPQFAIDKGETEGKYGRPKEYWERFRQAIADGTARQANFKSNNGNMIQAWEIGGVEYRILNPESPELVNTVIKMAKKRAHVDATISTLGLSEYFTQDFGDPETEGDDVKLSAAPAPVVTNDPQFDQREPAQAQQQQPKAQPEPPKPLAEETTHTLKIKALTNIGGQKKILTEAAQAFTGKADPNEDEEALRRFLLTVVGLGPKEAVQFCQEQIAGVNQQDVAAAQPAAPQAAASLPLEEFAKLNPSRMCIEIGKKAGAPQSKVMNYFLVSYGLKQMPQVEHADMQQEAINLYELSPEQIREVIASPVRHEAA